MHVLFFNQLIDNFIAHSLHVQGATGDKMLERFFTLGAADQTAGTAGHHFAFYAFNVGMTYRAMGGKHDFTRLLRAF